MWLGHFPLLILNRGQHLLYLTDNMGTDCYISSSFFARSPRQEPFFGIHKHTIPTEPIYNMSNHTLSPQNGVHSSSEDRIQAAIVEVRRIADWQPSMSESLEQCLYIARAAIRTFDSTGFTSLPNYSRECIFVLNTLQRLAYHDTDSEGIRDIADWCINQWLQLLQREGESLSVLRGLFLAYQSVTLTYIRVGLGQAWLARSQILLARIHRLEGSSSSGSSGRPQSWGEIPSYSSSEEARDAGRAAAEADARAHTADYVEARGRLIPAVDYFSRAVAAAERDGRLDGDILSEVSIFCGYINLTTLTDLCQAAEASMSLGNVSYSHSNEQHFHRAIRYLRRASQLPGYRLSVYLQGLVLSSIAPTICVDLNFHRYLDDYGRLVD